MISFKMLSILSLYVCHKYKQVSHTTQNFSTKPEAAVALDVIASMRFVNFSLLSIMTPRSLCSQMKM